MPDLTLEAAWTCSTNTHWETPVTGSKGDVYRVAWERLYGAQADRVGALHGWTCECKGFEMRGTCRHIALVEERKERCGWNACLEPTLSCEHDDDGEPCCPDCGNPVEAFQVAV